MSGSAIDHATQRVLGGAPFAYEIRIDCPLVFNFTLVTGIAVPLKPAPGVNMQRIHSHRYMHPALRGCKKHGVAIQVTVRRDFNAPI